MVHKWWLGTPVIEPVVSTPSVRPQSPQQPSARQPASSDDQGEMRVYFFYPDKSERYMGTTRGAEGCQRVAANFAATQKLDGGWSYGCCDKPDAPDCKKKLK